MGAPDPELYDVRRWPAKRIARFLAFIPRGASTACWRWTGNHFPKGIGRYRFREDGRMRSAYPHRVVWAIEHGSVPAGREVAHACENVDCCNPAHLVLATPGERAHLLPVRGRSRAGALHHAAKLTAAQVRRLRALKAARPELTGRELAAKFGISTAQTNAILRGAGWRDG